MLLRIALRSLVLGALLAALFVAPALAVPTVAGEFDVSGLDSNDKLVQGPDGNMWVALTSGTADVAKITPAGAVTEYDLEAEGPSGIAVAAGKLWITRSNGVTSFEPKDPEGSKDPTTIGTITGTHSIVLGPDGNLWVATSENLVRIPPAKPSDAKSFPVAGLSPRDIDVAGSLLAIADFGGDQVLTATPTDPPVIVKYPVGGEPQGVAGGPNGQVAFTQPSVEPKQVGVFTPPAGKLLTTNVPVQDPFGITLGTDGAYWSPERNEDKLIRLTTDNKVSFLTGFSKASSPRQIATGPGNTLWVTLETAKKVAKVTGVDPPPPVVVPPKAVPVEPRTTVTKGPKGKLTKRGKKKKKVTFSFESPDAGATFECRVEAIVKKKKAKASVVTEFKPCTSPKSFKLMTGHYRFEVRALLAGVPDQTPETRSFRIVRAPAKK